MDFFKNLSELSTRYYKQRTTTLKPPTMCFKMLFASSNYYNILKYCLSVF